MFIEKLSIESFGSLSNVSYDLQSGINIFHGKNESGKSTLAAFIKFIFYGLCGKTPDTSMSEKTRYTNWDHGISGGSLVINKSGIRYRIERRITPAAKAGGKETVKVIDLTSNTEVFSGKCPGEVFFGVGEEIFSQTAFSAQGSGSVVDSEKMNTAIDNMMLAGNETLNVKGALKKLDEARVFLLHKNRKGGKLFEMGQEMNALEERIEKAKENEAFLSERSHLLDESRAQLENNRKLLKKLDDTLIHYEAGRILARFEDLDNKERAYLAASENESELIARNTVNGFIPNEEYGNALKALRSEIDIAEQEKASLLLQKEAFAGTSLSADQRTVLKQLDADGGKENAITAMRTKGKKRANAKKAASFLLILALVTLIASLTILMSHAFPPAYAYIGFGIGALFAALSLVRFTTLPSSANVFRPYLSEREDEALRRIDDALRAEKLISEEDERYARLQSAIENINAKIKEKTGNAKLLLEKWGLHYENKDSLLVGADKTAALLRALREAHVAGEGARIAYEASRDALKSYQRENYRKRFADTAYVEIGGMPTPEELERNRSFSQKKEYALNQQIRGMELDIAARSAVTENLTELEEALRELKARYDDYAEKCKAYIMAYEAIRKSGEALRSRIAPALSKSASALMQASTAGKYADIGVDNSMTLSFRADEASPSREVGFMSAGTKALTYISLRLSLIRLLFHDEMPPTVFDESFSWLDDTRLTAMMSLLQVYAQDAQVIVMTCCDREYEACRDKENVNLIEIAQ